MGKQGVKNGEAKPQPNFGWEELMREIGGPSLKGRSHPGFTLEEYKEKFNFSSYTAALRDLRRRSELGQINCIEGMIDGKPHELFVKPPLGVPSRVPKD